MHYKNRSDNGGDDLFANISTDLYTYQKIMGFLNCSVSKEFACNSGDVSSIPGSGRPLGGGNGNPLQYSCLENPMDRGAWLGYSPNSRKELGTTEQLRMHP